MDNLETVPLPPITEEFAVDCLSRARKAEQEVVALKAALRKRGYTDVGMNRWIAEHFAQLRRDAALKGS